MSKDFELLNDFERSDSICSPSPQAKLLSSLEAKNIDKFVEVLKNNLSRVDVNCFYEAPENGTLLDVACRSKGNRKFVDILIQYGADVNAVNCVLNKTPLHVAVEKSDAETVEALVRCSKCKINTVDSYGNTALHIAAKENKVNLIEILLKHPAVDINAVNRKHQTPLHLALTQGCQDAIRVLVARLDVDLDEVKDFRDRCCREIINEKYPEFQNKMELSRMRTADKGLNENLFLCLRNRDIKSFLRLAKVNKNCLNDNNGTHTYLQYACETGLTEVVETLLNLGVDPNGCCPNHDKPPAFIAAERGYHNILRTLIRNGDTSYSPVAGSTVLHAVFNGMFNRQEPMLGTAVQDEECDYHKCLKHILTEVPPERLNINYQDSSGNTVLHYAVKLNDDEAVKALLDAGAYVGQKNNNGTIPLESIKPSVLEEYLDGCVSTNDKTSREEGYEIIYDYKILTPPRKQSYFDKLGLELDQKEVYDVVSETEPLLVMNDVPELRKLLTHPVLTSFLNLKWYTIRKYFFINLIFYLAFWLFLTFYVLYTYGLSNNNRTSPAAVPVVNNTNSYFVPDNDTLLWYITSLLCIVLFLREFFQFCISPWPYVRSPENWLEVGLIIITASVLTCQTSLDKRPQLAAVAILASWMELILLIGRHPLLSTNIEMFKTVTINFLKFLAWYSILILAFAFSFYILFNDRNVNVSGNGNPQSDGDDRFFRDPAMSVFKSVIMLTGEFDAGSIPFGDRLSTSHLLFILFVFLVSIVLFNLLNGLAVSDTQAIRADAELVGIVSRVKLISYVETMATSDPFPCLTIVDKLACCCCCAPLKQVTHKRRKHVKMFYKKINLFPYTVPESQIRVRPNEQNAIVLANSTDKLRDEESCFARCSTWKIDRNIIKDTVRILEKYRKRNEAINYSELIKKNNKKLQEYKSKLDLVESASERNEKLLKEIMGILKQRL